jgi:quinol-cytochrome oxidoreductase complex cytochrome b subunit
LLKRLFDWLDARSGYRHVVREALDEPIPGGARWRYVFGSCLTGAFVVQAVTGVLLMTGYSPSATSAWGSVYHLTFETDLGWFVRGLHHFGAQAMVVLLGLHMIQVLLAGAYRAPRELNWWFGLALLGVTLALALTGYLLPWDQKGYWATRVATNILAAVPGIGPALQRLVVGGAEYGNHTLTRFYALHVAVLPALLVLLIVVHVSLFRRHGVTHPEPTRGRLDRFWPKQVFLDTAALTIVLAVVAGFALYEQFHGHGIPLDAPADPTSSDYPARPEWYFLSLFQLLNQLPQWLGGRLTSSQIEVVGTVIVPGAIFVLLLLLPFLDKVLPRRGAHFLACALVFVIVGGAGYLTWMAMRADATNPSFQEARRQAEAAAERAKFLARDGIPPEGAATLLTRDPATRGRAILERSCLGCHARNGQAQVTRIDAAPRPDELAGVASVPTIDGLPDAARRAIAVKLPDFEAAAAAQPGPAVGGRASLRVEGTNPAGERVVVDVAEDGRALRWEIHGRQTAPDLFHFGSRGWLRGLLENPGDARYFGRVESGGGMQRWKKNSKLTPRDLNAIADFFAQHVLTIPEDLPASEWAEREEVQNHPAFQHFAEGGECATCHTDWVYPNEEAPNLYGWGTSWWARRMIRRPGAPHHYGFLGEDQPMPAFADRLTDADLEAVVRYLKDDYVGAEHPPSGQGGRPGPVDTR